MPRYTIPVHLVVEAESAEAARDMIGEELEEWLFSAMVAVESYTILEAGESRLRHDRDALVAEAHRAAEQIRAEYESLQEDYKRLVEEWAAQKPRKMGPLAEDHPLVSGDAECPGCKQPFASGEAVTLVAIGPGDDPEEREKARNLRTFNAVSLPAHWACVTGEED